MSLFSDLSDREERVYTMQDALSRIAMWSDAYPLPQFPEPDHEYLRRARDALEANGMTLDVISASAVRHVIKQVGKIARDALKDGE
jgi:hypothetical protein